MTEAIGTAASLLALLEFAVKATQFLKDIKHGSGDRLRLRDELRSTTCLVEMLKDRIDDSDDEALTPASISSLGGPEGPVKLFRRLLEDIVAKLAPQDRLRRLAQPFSWPFEKKEVAELLASLERLKSHFNLVLQNDLVGLAKLSNLKLDEIRKDAAEAKEKARDEEIQKIIRWLSPLAYRARHIDILETVQPGTGAWFLGHTKFRNWTQGNVDTLWCPGIPGAGKTRMASLVVDHLEREITTPFAYIYCDYSRRTEQTAVALLSSVLQQILQRSRTGNVLPENLTAMYQQHKRHNTRPTLVEVTDALRDLVVKLPTFHVVVDALDECADSDDDALGFVSAVRALGPGVKLLCTSRFSTTFESHFSTADKLEISAHGEDIAMFLDSQMAQRTTLARHIRADPTLKEEILDAITGESRGMFLLARLHLDALSTKFNRKALRAALKDLPATLDDTYADALRRIQNQAPDLAEVGQSILSWVIFAKTPLSIVEMRHMYATRHLADGDALSDEDLPDEEILMGACGGLIRVDPEDQLVRTVHYTTQEYFERSHLDLAAAAKFQLADVSLAYLMLPNFSDWCPKTYEEVIEQVRQYPFLWYASKNWGADIGKLPATQLELLWPRLDKFASHRGAATLANQIQRMPLLVIANVTGDRAERLLRSSEFPALDLAADFDMPTVLRRLITQSYPIEDTGNWGGTALIRAAGRGLEGNVRVLLEHGAEVNARDYTGLTALDRASGRSYDGKGLGVVRALIDASADVNARSGRGQTPVMRAASAGNLAAVKVLVKAGADLTGVTVRGCSALTEALDNNRWGVATFLADRGAVLPRTSAGRSALARASRKGLHELVQRLSVDFETEAGQQPVQQETPSVNEGLQLAAVAEGA